MRKKLVNKTSIKNIFIRKSTWILVAIFIVGIITIPSFISKAGSESRSVDYANEIRVLEIEPGNKFLFKAGKQKVNDKDVNVTQMTMPEFISTVDQLTGKYDAVVIARENSGLASEFKIADQTKYFDYSAPFTNHLDKAKYTSAQDDKFIKALPYSYTGKTDNGRDFDEYYSENDITDRRAKDVISMIENNQLVYIDKDITNSTSLENTKLFTNFKNFENKTSNIVVPRSEITLENIVKDYNNPDYSKRAYISKLEASGDDSKVNNIGSDGKVYGSYDSRNMKFTITVPYGADGYKANLYFDINADGIYTENEMEDTFDLSKSEYNVGNNKYTIKANMDVTFVGYLDWKIELVNKESGKVSSYVTYHTVFKALEGHRRGIKVLQIHPTGTKDDSKLLYLCPLGSNSKSDSQETFNNVLALEEVANSGYDLDIHSMSAEVFNEKTDADHNYLDTEKYDMIIVGFGDNYINNQLNTNACNAIEKFIKDGKSCMFTHDTITLNTFGGINDNWDMKVGPKEFGQRFRDIAGQARYVDPYRNSGKKANASNLEERDLDGSTIPHDKLPSSLGDNTYSLGTTFYMNNYDPTLKTEVKNVNNAQITSYPFNLSDDNNRSDDMLLYPVGEGEINVAQTHTQWFQLNLEDEDVVPWFNLSGSNINSGDSRNFYYTYSKGNITYSGTGHSNGYPKSEMKLFVNTIIKADRGANFAPNVINYVLELDNKVAVTNNSGAKAKELRISPAGKGKWSDNYLESELDNGKAVEVHFKGDATINYWDIKLIDVDGNETVWSNVSSDEIFKSESIDLLVEGDNKDNPKISCVLKEVLSKVSYEAGSEISDGSLVQSENGDFKVDGSEDFYFVSKVKDLNQDDIKVSIIAKIDNRDIPIEPIWTAKSKEPNKSQFKDTTNVFGAGSYVGGKIDKAYIQKVAGKVNGGEITVIVSVADAAGATGSSSFGIGVVPNHPPVVTNFYKNGEIANEATVDKVSREEDFIFDSLITDEDKDDLKEVVITLDGKEILREENVKTGDDGHKITGITIPKEILSTKAPGATFEVLVTATDVKGGTGTKGFSLGLEQEKIEVKHYFVESRKEDGTIDKATIIEHNTSINMESKIEAVGYVSKIYEYNKTVKLKIDNGLKITPGTEVKLYVEANNNSVVMNKIKDKEKEYECTLTQGLLGDIDMLKGAKIRVEYSVDILQMPNLEQDDTRYSNILSVDDRSATITIIDKKFKRFDDKEYPYLF